RMAEAPYTHSIKLSNDLVRAIKPYLEIPVALFGHSMGGLLAFDVARRLRRGYASPVHLFVSACAAPQLPTTAIGLGPLSANDLLTALRSDGPPSEALQIPELRQIFMPLIRADISVCGSYRYTHEPPLDTPITAICGEGDQLAPLAVMLPWSVQTRAE